jgi:hypothetical protein
LWGSCQFQSISLRKLDFIAKVFKFMGEESVLS